MLGGIIGDIVGSRFEFHNLKNKEFELFTSRNRCTDDSIMTIAIAMSLLEAESDEELKTRTIENMQLLGNKYPNAGYGARFASWLASRDPKPYHSFGNGAAMRVSPVGHVATSLDGCRRLSNIVTKVTHDHAEGLKGAEAVASLVYLARIGKDKAYMRDFVVSNYYDLDFTLDDIRDKYFFKVDCEGSVPEAIEAFLEGEDFEDTIRNAISIGGDSDTIACIAGSIAEPYFKIPYDIRKSALPYMDDYLRKTFFAFEEKYGAYTLE